MSKSISFKKPSNATGQAKRSSADQWVEHRVDNVDSAVTKRFTIDVPLELHRRIKMACAMRGENMAEMMRRLLNREFPKEDRKS